MLLAQGAMEDAIAAIAMNPNSTHALVIRAAVHGNIGTCEVRGCDPSLPSRPTARLLLQHRVLAHVVYRVLARALSRTCKTANEHMKHWDEEALDCNGLVHCVRLAVLLACHEVQDGLADWDKALHLDPTYADVLAVRGSIKRLSGDEEVRA